MGLKSITLQGNLVKDPETRSTQSGIDVTQFTVAVSSNKAPRDGQEPPAQYFRVSTFGKLAKTCSEHLQKGRSVSVVGDLEASTRENNGKTYINLDVQADKVFFGPKREQTQQTQQQSQPQQQQSSNFEDDFQFQ